MKPARLAFTREMTPAISNCELTHVARTPIHIDTARAQHKAYEDLLKHLGCTVHRLKALPTMADAVFIEDAAVVLPEIAIITRPGAPSRRAEVAGVAEALKAHRKVLRIEDTMATIDGGDVIVAGKKIFVGQTARTNAFGRDALVRLTSQFGYHVDGITVTKCLHLKSAACLVAPDTMLINPTWAFKQAFHDFTVIEVDPSEPYAANALAVGNAVVHAAEFPRTRERLERAGLHVHPIPASELAKAEGGVTCCCLIFDGGKKP
jgi:dimethylargininase